MRLPQREADRAAVHLRATPLRREQLPGDHAAGRARSANEESTESTAPPSEETPEPTNTPPAAGLQGNRARRRREGGRGRALRTWGVMREPILKRQIFDPAIAPMTRRW